MEDDRWKMERGRIGRMSIIKMDRKGYFFVVDAFIAGIILFTSLMLLLSRTSTLPPTAQTYQILDSFMEYIAKTEIRDISNPIVTGLSADGNITNDYFTVVEQVAQMYDRHQTEGCSQCIIRARALVNSLAMGNIPENYGYSYVVNDTLIAERYPEIKPDSFIVASQSIVVFTSTNLTKVIGPYVTEVEVWLR